MSEDVNFRKKEYRELFYAYLKDAYSQGLLSDDSQFLNYIHNREDIESNYIMQASVHNKTLETAYKDMGLIYNALSVDSANGSDLDNLGEKVGIYRKTQTPYFVELIFEVTEPATNNIIIPAETLISNSSNAVYYTVEEVTILKGETYTFASACSLDYDSSYKVNIGEITNIQSDLNNNNQTVSVRNTTNSSGGSETETDTSYRERIKNWEFINRKGTVDCYLDYLSNVEGLDGFSFIPEWDGAGTIKIILDPGTEYLTTKVYNDLIDYVATADEDITITPAIKKVIDLNLGVNVTIDSNEEYSTSEKDSLQSTIEELIKIYIDGGLITDFVELDNGTYQMQETDYTGLSIGENFIPSKCLTFIYNQLELNGLNIVQNIEFNIPSSFVANDSTDYYGNVDDDEIATSGNIIISIT